MKEHILTEQEDGLNVQIFLTNEQHYGVFSQSKPQQNKVLLEVSVKIDYKHTEQLRLLCIYLQNLNQLSNDEYISTNFSNSNKRSCIFCGEKDNDIVRFDSGLNIHFVHESCLIGFKETIETIIENNSSVLTSHSV